MTPLKEMALKPFEALAGRPYPDMDRVRHEANDPRDTIDYSSRAVHNARRDFVVDVVHLTGLKQALGKLRGEK